MNHCKTCKYWEPIHGGEFPEHEEFLCENCGDDVIYEFYEPPYPIGACTVAHVFYGTPDIDGFALADGEKYKASMATGAEFGCTRWEAAK